MDYEQHVREVAEEMVKQWWDEIAHKVFPLSYYEEWAHMQLENFLGAARIAVRREAEAVSCLLAQRTALSDESISLYLIERGLIPAPERSCNACPHCAAKLDLKNVCEVCGFTLY